MFRGDDYTVGCKNKFYTDDDAGAVSQLDLSAYFGRELSVHSLIALPNTLAYPQGDHSPGKVMEFPKGSGKMEKKQGKVKFSGFFSN